MIFSDKLVGVVDFVSHSSLQNLMCFTFSHFPSRPVLLFPIFSKIHTVLSFLCHITTIFKAPKGKPSQAGTATVSEDVPAGTGTWKKAHGEIVEAVPKLMQPPQRETAGPALPIASEASASRRRRSGGIKEVRKKPKAY